MDYKEFKEKVQNEIKDYLPSMFADTEVAITETMKVNKKNDSLMLRGIPGMENASPSIQLEGVYKDYEKTGDFTGIMKSLGECIEDSVKQFDSKKISEGLNFSGIKDKVFFTLVNAEQNADLLKNVPHRNFEDLAIIYRWQIDNDKEGLYTNIINNDFAKNKGLDEETLFEAAKKNTQLLFPTQVRNMNDVIAEMMFGSGEIPEEMKEEFNEMITETPNEKSMYVISNDKNIFGASAILYEENLQELSQKLNSNLYILPSSIHEVIAISTEYGTPEELAEMVHDVNMEEVDLGERLSNQVYKYDKDERTLRIASDSIYKSIGDDAMNYDLVKDEGKAR